MINSIHLTNFKSFENQSLSLGSLTLLSGFNNTGKSTVFQSLLLLRQSYQQGLLDNTGLALNGDLVRIGTAKDALFEGAKQNSMSFAIESQDGTKGFWKFAYNPESDVMQLVQKERDSQIDNLNLFSDRFHYLQAERINSHSPPDTLILLEHPEVHFHPKEQTKIGEFLAVEASCGVQIIVETHSDHLLNGIRLAVHSGKIKPEDVQLHHFDLVEQNGQAFTTVISPQIDRNGRIDRWPDGFFDEWEKSLAELLEPV